MKQQISTTKTDKMKPAQKFRAGSVTATVWGKEIKLEGRKDPVTVYNTTIVKNYKDGEEWKQTNSFNRDDLIKLQVVLGKTVEFLYLNEQEE